MTIDLLSFIFGALIMLAGLIVADKIYTKFWGSRKLRTLSKENRRLRAIIKKKDALINKSLQEMKKEQG